jgi:hypothetical protein
MFIATVNFTVIKNVKLSVSGTPLYYERIKRLARIYEEPGFNVGTLS